MALSFSAMFEWSLREGRTYVVVPVDQRRKTRLRTSFGTIVYAVVIVMAFISPPIALAIAGLTAVYYIFAPVPHASPSTDLLELEAGES
jgi:hypothetical protein